jgi:hypothetical protein
MCFLAVRRGDESKYVHVEIVQIDGELCTPPRSELQVEGATAALWW